MTSLAHERKRIALAGTRPLVLAVCLTAALLVAARSGSAQVLLSPGEYRQNLAASGRVIASSHPINVAIPIPPGTHFATAVTFDREDDQTQNMRLLAHAEVIGGTTATARGLLFVDFCVPRAGMGACDAVADPSAPDLTASITFRYGVVGVVNAIGLRAKATLGVTAAVVDLERSAFVNFQQLASVTASLGTIKTIAGIPVPLPDFDGATVNLPVTFTTLLKRGKRYRFQLAGASTAVAEWAPGSFASSDALYTSLQFPGQRGRIQLHDLTIQVANDVSDIESEVSELRSVTASLLEQVGNLAEQIEAQRTSFEGDIAALNEALNDLVSRTDISGSLLLLPAGSAPPPGFALVGTFDLVPSGGPRGRPSMVSVDLYRRQS